MGARRRARAAGVPGGCLWPEMRFVYDAPARVKHECRSCFAVNAVNGEPSVTNCGEYYKNVRSEWASLVTTPPTARFQDALAFTRSIGDLHLHAYGPCTPLALSTSNNTDRLSTLVFGRHSRIISFGIRDFQVYLMILSWPCTTCLTLAACQTRRRNTAPVPLAVTASRQHGGARFSRMGWT